MTMPVVKNETEVTYNLHSMFSVKEAIYNNGGLYDDSGKWISLNRGKIYGIVQFASTNKTCAIILNAKYQSLNEIYLDDDNKVHISEVSIGGTFIGKPTMENIKKYNDSLISKTGEILCYLTTESYVYDAMMEEINSVCDSVERGTISHNDTLISIIDIQDAFMQLYKSHLESNIGAVKIIADKIASLLDAVQSGNIEPINIVSRLDALVDRIEALK